jgi:hypothetical protein
MTDDDKQAERPNGIGEQTVAYSKRLYVIGDKETGVLFVTVDSQDNANGVRVARVTNAAINAYAAQYQVSGPKVFRDVAGAIQKLILTGGVSPPASATPSIISSSAADAIMSGTTISDAEFCLIADLSDASWETYRQPFSPLSNVLNNLCVGTGSAPQDPPLVKTE